MDLQLLVVTMSILVKLKMFLALGLVLIWVMAGKQEEVEEKILIGL